MSRRFVTLGRLAALCSILVFTLAACSDDDGEPLAADVRTLAEVTTDASGQAATVTPDGGSALRVTNKVSGLVRDSLYRVQALILPDNEGGAAVRQLAAVLSPFPREVAEDKRRYDPVDVLALWSTGRYVNMRLALRTATEPHAFTFVEEGTDNLPDGTRRLRLHLYHDRGGNPEYYTRETYLSCPLFHYADVLRAGTDSVYFTVTTYAGERTLRICYGE